MSVTRIFASARRRREFFLYYNQKAVTHFERRILDEERREYDCEFSIIDVMLMKDDLLVTRKRSLKSVRSTGNFVMLQS